jgi:hypothetical protein
LAQKVAPEDAKSIFSLVGKYAWKEGSHFVSSQINKDKEKGDK